MQDLPPEIIDLVESGVSILVGTCDAALRPASVRGAGARVAPSRRAITVYLPIATSERAARNLQENGQIAVGFTRPFDNLAVQIKGRCSRIGLADESERALVEAYVLAYVETTYAVGMPRALIKRVTRWPAWAVTFDARDVFSQTPGPGAGKRWGT